MRALRRCLQLPGVSDASGDTESATADADSSPTEPKSATTDAESVTTDTESASSAADSASADATAGAADSDAASDVVVTGDGTVVTDESDADGDTASSAESDAEPDGFGRQGWLLVVGVVVCFLLIPGVVYLKPAVPAAAGLPFFASFLVLPLLPAVGLGLLAVWSMRAAA